jgi:hypothetical protein
VARDNRIVCPKVEIIGAETKELKIMKEQEELVDTDRRGDKQ